MHAKKTLAIAAALLAATSALAGCSTSSSDNVGADSGGAGTGAAASATSHNKADIVFAQGMIPHHGQAIDMAKMAKSRASSAQVKKLAADIQAAQGPEIVKMTGWLRSWGAAVPSTDMAGMPGMDHGSGASTPGMMSNADMRGLAKAHGAAFDRMFLQMMIEHHQGALAMAKTEQAEGRNRAAVKLAESIQATQTAEIAKMRQMLNA